MKTVGLFLFSILLTMALPRESQAQVYAGGNIGFHYKDGTYLDVAPLIGYRYNKLDIGISPFLSYRDRRNQDPRYTYGNRTFAQITFMPNVFVHAEFDVSNIERADGSRKWINAFPVGGGYRYNLGDRTQAYGMVLYDLMLDNDSPVEQPIVRGGIIYSF